MRWNTGLKVCAFFNSERRWQLLLECHQFMLELEDGTRVDIPSRTIVESMVALVDYLKHNGQFPFEQAWKGEHG